MPANSNNQKSLLGQFFGLSQISRDMMFVTCPMVSWCFALKMTSWTLKAIYVITMSPETSKQRDWSESISQKGIL